MKTQNSFKTLLVMSLALTMAVGCSDDDSPVNNNGGSETGQKFFIAAEQDDATYLLTVDNLESGTATILGNGIEQPYNFTAFVANGTNSVMGLQYRQGDPALGMSFGLNSSGALQTIGTEFQMQAGFTTYGSFENYVIAARSGQTLTDNSTGSILYFIDQENNNNVSTKYLNTTGENDQTFDDGTGNMVEETGTLCGIVEGGNGEFFTSVIFSHGVTESGTGSSTATIGNPDEVWVAALDKDLNIKRWYHDDRISYSAGRYRSQYYSQIANDDAGNTYVFSGSYDSSSSKAAGAIRINNGSTAFDQNYYFNIQDAAGGYRFRKVWYIKQDYFLLEFYNEVEYSSQTPATQYAVVKMESKELTWLTSGFPAKEDITDTGLPFTYNGKLYFPVTTADAQPTVYVITPETATAGAGLVIEAGAVSALSRLTY